jgi:DHA2 family lincomycin resistance protein-like MFS transporter
LILPGSALVSAVMWGMAFMNEFTHVGWLLAAHIVLSIGLALMFTPLFSASLGSLPPKLYSHGSAVIGTIQQVAGAAGTALFIALMANQMAALTASGLSEIASTAGGIRTAYLWGAVISTFAVVAAFFVRKPAENTHQEASHAH